MPATKRTAIRAGHIVAFDGRGHRLLRDGVVVIEGERILAVGGRGQVLVPEGAQVISTEGMTVLPGLWDLQVRTMRLGHGDAGRWNETYGPLAERVDAHLVHRAAQRGRGRAHPGWRLAAFPAEPGRGAAPVL